MGVASILRLVGLVSDCRCHNTFFRGLELDLAFQDCGYKRIECCLCISKPEHVSGNDGEVNGAHVADVMAVVQQHPGCREIYRKRQCKPPGEL